MAMERSILRSVDSKRASRVIEPREDRNEGANVVKTGGGSIWGVAMA